jgi:F-type H+-transporting ATPase subunit b
VIARILVLVFIAVVVSAQHSEPASQPKAPAGGAEAVHPGGPASTHAEAAAKHGEGHEQHPMPNEIWWKWANFFILAGLLGWLISKHAGAFFNSRSDQIQRGIAEATKTRQDAEARAAEIERRVNSLSAEVDALRQRSKQEIAREGERVRAETEATLKKIQAQAEADIASAVKHATQDLKAYSARLALELAERQVRAQVDASVQERLAGDFVEELRRKAVSH